MPFQIKDFASIVAAEINHARGATDKITDFLPGSVARTLMEAPAVELEELYLQMFAGLREAIPVSVFRSFGFDRLPATRARGRVRLTAAEPLPEPLVIPAGTAFATEDGGTYHAVEATTWPAGESQITLVVEAEAPGATGNAAPGAITASATLDAAIVISNDPITTGRDLESDEEREARFTDYIRAISAGTTEACRYAASQARLTDAGGATTEYVVRTGLEEVPGRVEIFLYASGGPPSRALIEVGQRAIDGHRDPDTGRIVPGVRAGGVQVDVLAARERQVDVSASVSLFAGRVMTPALVSAVADSLSQAFFAVGPGATLHVGAMRAAILRVTGVREVVIHNAENVRCGQHEVLVTGHVAIDTL